MYITIYVKGKKIMYREFETSSLLSLVFPFKGVQPGIRYVMAIVQCSFGVAKVFEIFNTL